MHTFATGDHSLTYTYLSSTNLTFVQDNIVQYEPLSQADTSFREVIVLATSLLAKKIKGLTRSLQIMSADLFSHFLSIAEATNCPGHLVVLACMSLNTCMSLLV